MDKVIYEHLQEIADETVNLKETALKRTLKMFDMPISRRLGVHVDETGEMIREAQLN